MCCFCLLEFPLPLGVWERLCCVIVTLPGWGLQYNYQTSVVHRGVKHTRILGQFVWLSQIKIVCIYVTSCDLVHDVETVQLNLL